MLIMKYFELQFYDNDSYLLNVSKVDRHKYITCPTCKMILNKRSLIEERKNLKICMKYQIGKGLCFILYLKVKAFI